MSRNDAAAGAEKRLRKAEALISFVDDFTGGQPDELSAEVIPSKRFCQLGGAWRDLVARAMVPNIYLSPGFVSAAGSSREIVVVLVWSRDGQDRRLEGVCALTRRRLRNFLPLPTSSGKLTDHCFLSNPVVRRDTPEPVLHAIFDAIAAEPTLAKAVHWSEARADGPMADALSRVLAVRQSRLVTVDQRKRPILEKQNGSTGYNDLIPSANRRQRLRRTRRRLSESGDVREASYREPADVAAAVEEFLSLEASGWKGSNGGALACKADDSNFTRSWMAALAVTGDLRIEALRVDGKPIAMYAWALCGDWAFAWKISYDERFSKYGPGFLVLEQCTRMFLADDHLKFVDSGSHDDTGFIAKIWKETMPVADLIFDVRRGGSFVTTAMARLEKGLVDCKKRLQAIAAASQL